MKKLLLLVTSFVLIVILSGCEMGNTPTKKVENFLDNYRNLSTDVTTQLDDIVDEDLEMNDTQRTTYKDLLKKQYEDLTYEIKDETVDGDVATVTVEIEVYDFYKATNDATDYYEKTPDEFTDDDGNILNNKFIDFKLDNLMDVKDRIKYTIDFTLSKVNNDWVLNEIDETTRLKIHGLYQY